MDNAPRGPRAQENGTNLGVTKVVALVALATAAWTLIIGITGAFVASPASTSSGSGSYGDIITGAFWAASLCILGMRLRSNSSRGAMMAVAVFGLLLGAGAFLTLGGYLAWGHDWDYASKARKVTDLLLLLPAGLTSLMLGFAALPAWGKPERKDEPSA